jgi:hypothetical protein
VTSSSSDKYHNIKGFRFLACAGNKHLTSGWQSLTCLLTGENGKDVFQITFFKESDIFESISIRSIGSEITLGVSLLHIGGHK